MKPFRSLARRLPETCAGISLFTLLLRMTVRDRIPGLSTVYYATPLPVIALVLAAAGATAILQRRFRWAAVAGIGSVVVPILFLLTAYRGTTGESGDLRGVLWNVSRGSRGWDQVASGLEKCDADLIALVEGGARPAEGRDALFGRAMPGGDARWFAGGMGLAVRKGKIRSGVEYDLRGAGRAVVVAVDLPKGPLEVVLVDLDPHPLRSRAPAFEALSRILGEVPVGNRLVLGDFNTPWESARFDDFRRSMTHAFDRSGNGFAPTWPLPIPVMELDHVWGRGVKFSSCRHEDLGASDHLAVVFDLTFAPEGPPRAPSAR